MRGGGKRSLWKVITGIVSGTVSRELRADLATHTLQTIEYAHHEIHNGNTFTLVDLVDLSTNNVRDMQIVTPNTTQWAHFFFSIVTESETEWKFYEDVTIAVTGTVANPYNADRNSATTPGLLLYAIDNSSVANADADTDISGATQIYHGISGAGKDSGEHNHSHEIILKQNSVYSIRLIANVAGYVNYHLDWYQHTNRS